MQAGTKQFFSGTSGLVLPIPNKQAFPAEFQDKSRLCYYASLFNSLEVNSSFYKVPMAITVKRWALSVPENFRFTFKLFKEITHNKELVFDNTMVDRFMQVIDEAGDKKGCLLAQFPPKTIFNLRQLDKLLKRIRKYDINQAWNLSVEFRHPSWYRQETYRLLSRHNATLVIHDIPKSATPLTTPWTNFIYLRFHGPVGDYRGSYTDAILHQYATRIIDWIKTGHTVYAYFNNTIGDAVKNLATLNGYVKRGG